MRPDDLAQVQGSLSVFVSFRSCSRRQRLFRVHFIFYERRMGRWLLFWSTTIPGRLPNSEQSGDDGYNHRAYCATTTNFQEFSASRLLYAPGFNMIDATLFEAGTKFYLFFKPFPGDWVEGPSAIKIKDEYLVYFDHYAAPHYYGAGRSKDLGHWEDCSKEMFFPEGHRHGTVLRIPSNIARNLLEEH